jgi:hypothetical protein
MREDRLAFGLPAPDPLYGAITSVPAEADVIRRIWHLSFYIPCQGLAGDQGSGLRIQPCHSEPWPLRPLRLKWRWLSPGADGFRMLHGQLFDHDLQSCAADRPRQEQQRQFGNLIQECAVSLAPQHMMSL